MGKEMSFVQKFAEAYKLDSARFKNLPGVTSNWSPEKLVKLYEMMQIDGLTQEEAAEELGVDRSTISRKDNGMNWNLFKEEVSKLSSMSKPEYIDYAAETVRGKQAEKKAAAGQNKQINVMAAIKNLEERLVNEAAKAPKMVLPQFTISRGSKGATPEEMVLVMSDAHVGLAFTHAETGGLGEYNKEIFARRAENLRKAVYEIYKLHSNMYRMPKLHILCLGDMVQGGNLLGEWGPAYIELPLDKQTVMAANAVSEMILSWEPLFDKISFTGVVGNHGRGGATKNSDKVSANWDNMVYALLEARLAEHKKIAVERSDSWWAQKDVLGTEILMVHGDYIQGNVTSLKNEEAKYQNLRLGGKPFNIMCIGHFHTHHEIETPQGAIMVNGSFVGGDVHSLQHMRTKSRPTQNLFGVHPQRGVTWKYRLDMDFERSVESNRKAA
jgi:DNA-binding XRE family transcriptional regulator